MKYFLPFLAAILLLSCRTTRKITATPTTIDSSKLIVNPLESDSAKRVLSALEKINAQRIEFTTFSSKLKIDYKGTEKGGREKGYSLNGVIRMQKDSVIWISVLAPILGEVMRVKITPDSVYVLNKQEQTVQLRKFDYLQEVSKLPMKFADLQNLLIGNLVFSDSNVVAYAENATQLSLTMVGKSFKNFSSFKVPELNLLSTQLNDVDTSAKRSAHLLYDQYDQYENRKFPVKRKISIMDITPTEIDLEFREPQFNTAVNFPFSIPDKYKLK